MARTRIGFIGAGRIADLHARAYLDNPDAELAAVADAAPGRAEARAREWGAERAYRDYRELLADETIDGVEVLLPHDLHSHVGIEALVAGKALSLQKPLGVSLAEADALLDAARGAASVFRVFDNFLSYEPIRLAKRLLDDGAIGDPLLFRISAVYGKGVGGWDIPQEAKAWRAQPEKVGGPPAIVDHGAHMAATVDWLMGPVERVHVFNETGHESSGVLNDAPMVVSMRFEHGCRLGTWTMARTSGIEVPTDYYPGDEFVEVTGSSGMLWINRCSGKLLDAPPVSVLGAGGMRHYTDVETDWGESFRLGGAEFARAIRDGTQPDMDATMARRVFAFQLAAVRSAAEGREVAVAEIG